MRVVRNKELSATPEIRIPPGTHVCRFYQQGELATTVSGVDCHPTGARLIKIVALLATPPTSDVVLAILKSGEAVFELTILPNMMGVSYDVSPVESDISMDFQPFEDTLQVSVVNAGSGGKDLTVLGIFDR